jgi:hypothetical protein
MILVHPLLQVVLGLGEEGLDNFGAGREEVKVMGDGDDETGKLEEHLSFLHISRPRML